MASKGGEDDVTRNPRPSSSPEGRRSSATRPPTSPSGPRKPAMATRPLAVMVQAAEDRNDQTWTGKDLSDSPRIVQDGTWAARAASPGPERRNKQSRKPTPLNIGGLTASEEAISAPPSPSRARWEHLRQHVLPIPIRAATPPVTQPHLTPPQQTLPLPPPRSQIPKPSRLARLGFRQVVEQAREVVLDDTRKFAQELQRVCWAIRYGAPEKAKVDREPATMGSALHLPFMSNASLTSTNLTGADSHPGKKQDLRRPPSIPTLATAYRSAPSLKPLYHVLLHHATSGGGISPSLTLPNELQVLSTLLRPFLVSEGGPHIEGERLIALDSFDVIIRTWAPVDQASGLERYLWCCKASVIPSSALRTRVVSTLWSLMIPIETNYLATTPDAFQTLAQGLFSLLPSLHPPSTDVTDQEDLVLLKEMIFKLRNGCCGQFDGTMFEEEYNAALSTEDDVDTIRGAMLLQALSRCLEDCTDETRLWLLQNSLQDHWITYPKGSRYTSLLAAIHTRTLNSFTRGLLGILAIPVDQSLYVLQAQHIARTLQKRVIPEIEVIGDKNTSECQSNVIKIIIELICMDKAREPIRWGIALIVHWYSASPFWKSSMERAIREIVANRDWPNIIGKLWPMIKLLPEEARKPLVAFVLPLLQDKLVEEPPPYPFLPLTNFFDTIARIYPQIFFKVLFSCAASSKEFTVVNYLCIIVVVSKFLPDFWIRDAEMMSVALMSDVGAKKMEDSERPSWAKARLGQSVLLLEVIGCIQAARREKDALTGNSEGGPLFVQTVRFALALESRLGVLLEVKERTALIPPSQRLLLCMLFRETRLLSRSLKTATWLPRVVTWFMDLYLEDEIGQDPEVEEKSSVGQLQGLYAAAQDGVQSSHQRRSTMLLSKTLEKSYHQVEASAEGTADLGSMFTNRTILVMSLSKGFVAKVMKLLVTMSTLLTPNDYRRLGPYLWAELVSDGDGSFTSSASFLIMQCAEKTPLDFLAVMEVDLQSSDSENRLQAIRKISILSNWRFQILSQHFITDRARRPFKLARGPLPFVATDIGSSLYIHEDDPAELKDSLPSELRKRLAEIGWDQDDTPVDQHQEWLKTPMSLLPTYQLDRLENTADPPPSPNVNAATSSSGLKPEDIGLLRRNSSTGGPLPGVKRRAVFVPSLASIFPRLASLVFDGDVGVASAARELIMDLMRNDPALLTRPILDLFVGEEKDVRSATSTINAFLHVRRTLPSPMAHYVFNNLAGFLKFASRHDDDNDALQDFAVTTTFLSKLVTQVSGMSIREIRRAKVDIFLIPSGSLWFPSSAPVGAMFPRGYEYAFNPFDGLPSHLVSITLIRVAQNLLFLAMLKRNRQDVALIRKSLSRLVLPSFRNEMDDAVLTLSDFIPKRTIQPDDNNLEGLSLMLSRSHILLVAQIFRSMSRHLNDRNELAILIDGLNRILLAHGDDIGIISQIMIALMVASTRFRRLFTSGGGYALFMPAVIKIYTEAEFHTGIRLAIEYAVNRFYALHREAFIFQTLDIMAHIAMLPNTEADWLGKSIYSLFFTLRRGVLPTSPDAAGIHDSNKVEEREALIVSTAEEKPQAFLSLLRRGEPSTRGRITIDLPDEYETNRLAIDDFVRLFLTVIAHDPSIVRAEQFLRLLRLLAPYLYQASASSRTVLQEGIDALGAVLLRASSKPKGGDSLPTHPSGEGFSTASPDMLLENQLLEKSRSPSDITAMRLDYLSLIVAFTRVGGEFPHPAVLKIMGLVTMMLKDASADTNNLISAFFTDFIRNSLVRDGSQSIKAAVATLQELAPLISAYTHAVDFSGVFESIAILAANPLYANNLPFSRVVVTQICASGLAACESASSESLISSLPSRTSFVALLAQAVLLRGVDVVPELEKRTFSYGFLIGIILPFTELLKTDSDLVSDNARSEPWHRDALASAWVRILSISMSTCQRIIGRTPERSKGHDKGRLTVSKQAELSAFVVALQVIKTIVIRAQADLSSHLPGVWARIASLLKTILAEGNANFACRAQDISPIATPTASPRASGQFDLQSPSSLMISTNFPNPSPQGQTFSNPRIVDYALWSLLELLCVHRNPLFLQMRLFTVEKLVELDKELQHRNLHSPITPRSRPVSTSVFSKPRRRVSGLPSPSSSPRLSPSQSFPHDTSLLSIDGRQAGYNNIASPQNSHGPRIVHLGPISATSMFGRGLLPGRGRGMDNPATTTNVKSLTLIRATYRRIRTVQTCMGYETLLPMPNNHEMDADEVFTTTWTHRQALRAIIQETKDLVEEFEESDRSLEDEGVMVDSFQPIT